MIRHFITLQRTIASARFNNPRLRPEMVSPPTISVAVLLPSDLPNAFIWNGARGSVFRYYNGVGTDVYGFRKTTGVLVSGVRNATPGRFEINADCAKIGFQFFSFESNPFLRFVVDGRYVSFTPTLPGVSGPYFVVLDFLAVGGRRFRNIVVEYTGMFGGAFVGITEGIYQPSGDAVRIAVVGDSFTASGGTSYYTNGYPYLLAHYLGCRDVINLGIGGTGWIAPLSGETTARGRIPDILYVDPDILIVAMGHNDVIGTAPIARDPLQAEVILFLGAIRAAAPKLPIIILGVMSGNMVLETAISIEDTIQSAVGAFADPNVAFIPQVLDPNGPWFTGTGATNDLRGDGNCDVYISADRVHPNDLGHAFLAARIADAMKRLVDERLSADPIWSLDT